MNDKKDWKTEQGEEHKILWSMTRKNEELIKGRTQNNVIKEKNDGESEKGEEHKIMWWMIRKT